MPKLLVDSIPVKVEAQYYDEFCELMEEKNHEICEVDEWVVKNKEKEKYYDVTEFLNDSNIYFNLNPPNLIQTSAKLWLACVYSVKEFFLSIGIHGTSHKSLNFLVRFAINKLNNGEMACKLTDGWHYAEQFHQYSYGSENFNPKHFASRKTAVEFFAANFQRIDKSAVMKSFLKIVSSKNNEIRVKDEPGKTNLGKKFFEYKYKVH